MKNFIYHCLNAFLILVLLPFLSCQSKKSDVLRFATSTQYAPFEYIKNGEFVGLDIELAQLIGKKLGKKVEFQDMQFSEVLEAVKNKKVDAAISSITITENRQKDFDFSTPYHVERMAMVFKKTNPITQKEPLTGKKIACELGTIMEIWLKNQPEKIQIITMDNNRQGVEALKSGHVEGVLMDLIQALTFTKENTDLNSRIMATAQAGYGIAFRKGSPLKEQVDNALEKLKNKGMIEKLKKKYLDVK